MLFKASSITNLTDARYFAAREVHFLGFNLEAGSPGYLDPVYMKAIREWVQGPKIVGEFDGTPAATILEAAAFYGLDALQVTRAADLPALSGLEVILALPAVPEIATLEALFAAQAPYVSCFLLDFTVNPAAAAALTAPEQAEAWRGLFAAFPVLLDLDLPASALPELLGSLQPLGLALRGGEEEQVGVKSFDTIEEVFEVLGVE